MRLYDQAVQFSPYAALVSNDEIIAEAGKLTDEMLDLTEDISRSLTASSVCSQP